MKDRRVVGTWGVFRKGFVSFVGGVGRWLAES